MTDASTWTSAGAGDETVGGAPAHESAPEPDLRDPDAPPVLIDGHLDLAHNHLDEGRDLTLPLDVLRAQEARSAGEAMVTLPELREAGVDVVFGTLFSRPSRTTDTPGRGTYDDAEGAHRLATRQMDLYERWEDEGRVRILRHRDDLERHLAARRAGGTDTPVGLVILMEGADPIRTPDEAGAWAARGVRIVGPAWRGTRYAGGTGEPGPLTPEGEELVAALADHELVLDVSHLAEEAFWGALDLHRGPVVASHSNARALVDSDRHLSDAMLRALGERNAVVGLVLANVFLRARSEDGPPVDLARVALHAKHVARFVGWDAVAVGSDFDGGFGRQETPSGLERGRDFARLAEAVPGPHRTSFLGGAWSRFLQRTLPTR